MQTKKHHEEIITPPKELAPFETFIEELLGQYYTLVAQYVVDPSIPPTGEEKSILRSCYTGLQILGTVVDELKTNKKIAEHSDLALTILSEIFRDFPGDPIVIEKRVLALAPQYPICMDAFKAIAVRAFETNEKASEEIFPISEAYSHFEKLKTALHYDE